MRDDATFMGQVGWLALVPDFGVAGGVDAFGRGTRVTTEVQRATTIWILAQVAALAVAACTLFLRTTPNPTTTPTPSMPSTATGAPPVSRAALFVRRPVRYTSATPPGMPGRKLTDGPADTEPAPSPDLTHVAYIHKAKASDYGGELWVLDLSPEHAPIGTPRRLIDPAALPPRFEGRDLATPPHRSCTRAGPPPGSRLPSLRPGKGGRAPPLVAAADSGEIVAPKQRLFANARYAWAPDGQHIAWTGGRSDVSPVNVNVLPVGATSTPVGKDTNAFSVTYATIAVRRCCSPTAMHPVKRSPGSLSHSVTAASTLSPPRGAPANLRALPTPLFNGHASYGDIAALISGAVAFTETSADGSSKTIQVLDVAGRRCPARRSPTWRRIARGRHGDQATSSRTSTRPVENA